jgi:hypothetical protein
VCAKMQVFNVTCDQYCSIKWSKGRLNSVLYSPVERRTAVEDLNLPGYDVVWIGK